MSKLHLTQEEYEAIPADYRGVWSTERTDIAVWPEIRKHYMGKRTMMRDNALLIEGLHFEIIADTGPYTHPECENCDCYDMGCAAEEMAKLHPKRLAEMRQAREKQATNESAR